jgi:hypothetical protein
VLASSTHGFLPDTVIVSDAAGQFNVGQHGLCWVHAERLVHTLDTFTQRKAALRARFDRIFARKTGFVTLDDRL